MKKEAKEKREVGRPPGPEKEPLNIYIRTDRAKRLRNFANSEQKSISIIVENALEKTYGL